MHKERSNMVMCRKRIRQITFQLRNGHYRTADRTTTVFEETPPASISCNAQVVLKVSTLPNRIDSTSSQSPIVKLPLDDRIDDNDLQSPIECERLQQILGSHYSEK